MNYDIKTDNREQFASYLKDKSVAIVGRAEYLNHMEQGEFMDSHDIVIRAHSNLPYPSNRFVLECDESGSFVPQSHQPQLGKKTDVFAPANLPFWDIQYIDELIPRLMRCGCQWLIQHKSYNVPTQEPADKRLSLSVIDYITGRFMPVFVASPQVFDEVMRELDYSFPMPGTLLIEEIIRLNPSRVYVTGFTCYMDNKERWLAADVSLTRDHKPLYDLRYLRDRERKGCIETDDVMKRYFDEI